MNANATYLLKNMKGLITQMPQPCAIPMARKFFFQVLLFQESRKKYYILTKSNNFTR